MFRKSPPGGDGEAERMEDHTNQCVRIPRPCKRRINKPSFCHVKYINGRSVPIQVLAPAWR